MYDAIIIGSGVGGSLAAHRLVNAGWRVLMLERGPRVERGPSNWETSLELTSSYSKESAFRITAGGYGRYAGMASCLGGPSLYFGAAALRYREADFDFDEEICSGSGARWPFRYDDLEPYYCEAERVIGVAGDDEGDPTRPRRSAPFPQQPAPLSCASSRFKGAARELGLNAVRLPLAINYTEGNGRQKCVSCRTCDTFACAIGAKNDMERAVLAPLERRGLEVRTETVVTRLIASDGRVTEVQGWDKVANERMTFRGANVILAAGSLATPHLLLASAFDRLHPSGSSIGRYLTRHCSALVFGFCNFRPDPERVFHKQLIVFDYYFGDERSRFWRGRRLGSIQQVSPPPPGLMKAYMSGFWERVPLHGFVEHLAGALVMSEDEPRRDNGVLIDAADPDRFGMPRLCVNHVYTRSDLRRRAALVRRAKRILGRVGAWSFHTHKLRTFSHGLGTVRMGVDPATCPLDETCRLRGLANLLVVDGSALPTSAGVNPALTIAANSLRAADLLLKGDNR
jgi:choline dehydrogenase-like flavoprotein